MKISKAHLIAAQRELGLRGQLRDFVAMAWPLVEPGSKFIPNWHIDAVCDVLESVYRGDILNLLINIPPGAMKSLLASVFWPVWIWIQDPTFRLGSGSYDGSLTQRDSEKSLQIMQSDWFQERWGDKFKLEKVPATAEYTNNMMGLRFATSVGGKLTGRHFHAFMAEDPHKPMDLTKNALDSVENWWMGTVASRFVDPSKPRQVVVMQRLHDRDLSGICEATGDYEVLKLPMRYEPKTAWIRDPRKEAGELLWPERFPEVAVARLEKRMGSAVSAAQLQQRPNPEGGAIFKREWFKRWTALPDQWDASCHSWDLAFKGEETSDYVAGATLGRKGPDFYVIAMSHDRRDFPKTLIEVRRVKKAHPKINAIVIEDKANGSAVISTLKQEIFGVIAVNPQGGKIARANAIAPIAEGGNIWLPPGPEGDSLLEELVAFPRGAYDDQVDCVTQGVTYLQNKAARFLAAMRGAAQSA